MWWIFDGTCSVIFSREIWEPDFYPVLVLGRVALPMRVPNSSPLLDKICAPMGPEIFIQYWGWGLGEGS